MWLMPRGSFDPDNLLAPLQAASCTYRIAGGTQSAELAIRSQPRRADDPTPVRQRLRIQPACGGAARATDQRQALEHLCRYITRPAIANERLSVNHAGQVVLELKTAYRDGTSHIVMSPLEFMQRLAALVPRPCLTPHPFSWGAGASRPTVGCDCADSCADDNNRVRNRGAVVT
jgi:hypothetical protein